MPEKTEVIIVSKIEFDRNTVDAKDVLREAKKDGQRLTKKYARLRGITKVETKVEADEKHPQKSYADCKECKKQYRSKSSEIEDEEDCGCSLDDEDDGNEKQVIEVKTTIKSYNNTYQDKLDENVRQ